MVILQVCSPVASTVRNLRTGRRQFWSDRYGRTGSDYVKRVDFGTLKASCGVRDLSASVGFESDSNGELLRSMVNNWLSVMDKSLIVGHNALSLKDLFGRPCKLVLDEGISL